MLRRRWKNFLRLGKSEDEKLTLDNEKIDQVVSFSCFDSIISKDSGSSEDVKNRTSKTQGVFSQLRSSKEKEDKPANQD